MKAVYKHSVSLDIEKCKGCTACLKRCPTEAIRIHDGHAVISSIRCIDCGECIKVCPSKAKKATHDSLSVLEEYRYTVALPAPSFYGQFDNLDNIGYIIKGLLDLGFDDVFEVACAAELVSAYTREYINREGIKKPVISSACPTITRLISTNYPYLCENIMPILPPIDIAAFLAREKALREHPELSPEDIGIIFISPCPAKVSYVKNPLGVEKSAVTGAVSVNDFYFKIRSKLKDINSPESISKTGIIGINWAGSGGEATSLLSDKYLAADGVENCIKVLDEIENGMLNKLEFVELNACIGGCVGGTLNVENPFIAKARLRSLRKYLPISRNALGDGCDDVIEDILWTDPVESDQSERLSDDRATALMKMMKIEDIYKSLPHLDCGSCGAPNCHALAEDIVKGVASHDDCVIRLKAILKKNN
jgi:Fe-S-cluster-containing hydrogenase component 2